jgi:hypothetical protein
VNTLKILRPLRLGASSVPERLLSSKMTAPRSWFQAFYRVTEEDNEIYEGNRRPRQDSNSVPSKYEALVRHVALKSRKQERKRSV